METNETVLILTHRLDQIRQAEALIGPVDFPEIAAAHATLTRVAAIDVDVQELRDLDRGDLIQATAAQYAAGEIDVRGVALAAAQIESGNSMDRAMNIIDIAKTDIASAALKGLTKIGERWLTVLGPAIDQALRPLDRMRDRLPEGPMYDTDLEPNVRSGLEAVGRKYETLWDLGAGLVEPSYRTRPANTRMRRWLHPERYTGATFPYGTSLSILGAHYRAGAQPGLWTQQQVDAAARSGPTPPSGGSPKGSGPSAALDANQEGLAAA